MNQDIFQKNLIPSVKYSRFDLSHDVKMSLNMGEIVPTACMEVLPGDTFTMSVENMLRFAPLVSPVMHRINVTTHSFFVPLRILWKKFPDWIAGEHPDIFPPHIVNGHLIENGSLGDYLGYNKLGDNLDRFSLSAFPLAAYTMIYDEYYRDQNLQDETHTPLEDSQQLQNNYEAIAQGQPFKRAWNHDYFTSCLPFAQKGQDVNIPLLQQGAVDVTLKDFQTQELPFLVDPVTKAPLPTSSNTGDVGTFSPVLGPTLHGGMFVNSPLDGQEPAQFDPNGTLQVDLASEAASINSLRRAFKLQEWLERNARGGTRYIEFVMSHFNVKSSDRRMQRPEYIGGAKQTMTISEVLSTAQTVDSAQNDIPVGNMSGHGISYGGGNRFSFKAEEHGLIINLINIQPVTAYQQGIHKSMHRMDPLDYAFPTFANIGEQEVKNYEIYAEGTTTLSEAQETFGYIPRYAEYKYMNNRVAGDMKGNLSFWHLARQFNQAPVLNDEFITCNPDKRIFAVTDPNVDSIYAHIYNDVSAVRALPRFGIPQF